MFGWASSVASGPMRRQQAASNRLSQLVIHHDIPPPFSSRGYARRAGHTMALEDNFGPGSPDEDPQGDRLEGVNEENDDAAHIRPAWPAAPATVLTVSDRLELIERIKRGESPSWVPPATVSARLFFAR